MVYRRRRFGRKFRRFGRSGRSRRGVGRFGRRVRRFGRRGHLRLAKNKIRPIVSPDATYLKLIYYTSSEGGSQVTNELQQFRANSIYDPEYATGGDQPDGYNQWGAFYQSYQVTASKITVDFYNKSERSVMIIVIPTFGNGSTPPGLTTDVWEQPLARWKILRGPESHRPTTRIKYYMTTQKMFARPLTSVDTSVSLWGGNPGAVWFWNVLTIADPVTIDNDNFQLEYHIKIKYYVKAFNRKLVTRSEEPTTP